MFGTTHPVTVSQPTGLQFHIEFLEQSWWKNKIMWITWYVMKIYKFLDRARDYKRWDWIQFVSSLIKYFCTHRKLVQTLPWVVSTYKNIRIFKKLPLFTSSSKRRGYNLLGPLLLPEHGNTPHFDYELCTQYYFTKKFRHELLAYFGMFGYIWHTHETDHTCS